MADRKMILKIYLLTIIFYYICFYIVRNTFFRISPDDITISLQLRKQIKIAERL
jgi:sugar phosphate permease